MLYQTVAEHHETWLDLAGAGQFDGQGDHHAPKPYMRKAFEKYLECGIFAHGFARARCGDCGHDFLVAFSCKGKGKGKGVCPCAKRAVSWSTAAPNSTASRAASGQTNATQSEVQSTGHRPTNCTSRHSNS